RRGVFGFWDDIAPRGTDGFCYKTVRGTIPEYWVTWPTHVFLASDAVWGEDVTFTIALIGGDQDRIEIDYVRLDPGTGPDVIRARVEGATAAIGVRGDNPLRCMVEQCDQNGACNGDIKRPCGFTSFSQFERHPAGLPRRLRFLPCLEGLPCPGQ